MFGIFKKKSWRIDGKIFDFFNKLFTQLPIEFQFLSEGLNKGLYRKFSANNPVKEHYYTIHFDPSQSDKSMIKGKQFELENIIVVQNGKEYHLTITVYEGLWIGFEIEKNVSEIRDYQFSLTKLHKAASKFKAASKIQKLVNGLSSTDLDLNNLSEFEIDGKCFYQIKDLEDGNYIAIDSKGQVFGLIHDPYRIELINTSINQFVDDVNNGKFSFREYLNGNSSYLYAKTS